MRCNKSVLSACLWKILKMWLGEQGICRANHAAVRPCSFNFCLIRVPICIFCCSIKKDVNRSLVYYLTPLADQSHVGK